jgi:hypothetical protein
MMALVENVGVSLVQESEDAEDAEQTEPFDLELFQSC